jgi:predicted O-methyltransferase YrrM
MSLQDDYRAYSQPWSDIQDCLPRLYEAAAGYPKVRVLELGVRWGTSTSAFLAAAEKTGGYVWSCDVVLEPQVPVRWLDSGYWTFILGDDMVIELPPGLFDVVFIDTSHSYLHTLAELTRFTPLVAKGGTMFFHDTRLDPVWLAGQPPLPVARALNEFCQATGRTWTDHDAQYGLGEIVHPNG